MKILITGAAGFIGFHLVEKLSKYGFEIIGLDNINNYYSVDLKFARLKQNGINSDKIIYGKVINSNTIDNYKFIKLNLEDKEQIELLFKSQNFDIVINLAAQAGVRYSISNPYAYINSNLIGFMNILESCKNNSIKHLYYASSSSVYGKNTKVPFSENDNVDNPVSLYAATKKSNELLATSYHNLYKMSCTGLRFFTVYGPWGRPDMAYYSFTESIMRGETIKIYNNGNLRRDFTYIDDIIRSIYLLIQSDTVETKKLNRVINIGNNEPVNLLEFISVLEKSLNKVAKKKFLPMQKGDVLETYADITLLMSIIEYRPKVNLNDGIERFIQWYRNFKSSAKTDTK